MHIRAFEHDERLLGLAFLDTSIYVTSIRTLKNLLLIGDVEKSVWFAVFQVRRPFVAFALQPLASDADSPPRIFLFRRRIPSSLSFSERTTDTSMSCLLISSSVRERSGSWFRIELEI